MGEALSPFSSIFRGAASRLMVGCVAIVCAWLTLAAAWPAALVPDSYLRPSLKYLLQVSHPVGAIAGLLAASVLVGDILIRATSAAVRSYTSWYLRTRAPKVSTAESSPRWPRWPVPIPAPPLARFRLYVENHPSFPDVLGKHRSALMQEAVLTADTMIKDAHSFTTDGNHDLRKEEIAILRLSIAPFVLLCGLLFMANIEGIPFFLLVSGVGLVSLLSLGTVVGGWTAWRESQGNVLDMVCETKADLTVLMRTYALLE